MNLNRIKLFRTVAKRLNVTRAAQALHVSQSAISHQLNLLQNHYQIRLYHKRGHGIELTEDGRRFLNEVEPILERLERFERQFGPRSKVAEAESLNVGGSYGLSAVLLPAVLAEFQRTHPDVQVSLRTGHRTIVEQLVIKGAVDIALLQIAGNFSSLLVAEPFGSEKLVAFASTEHPLAKKPKVTLAEILRGPLIISGDRVVESNVKMMLRELESKGYRPRIGAFYDSPDAVKIAVKKKTGVGLLYYKALIKEDVVRGELKILNVQGLRAYGRTFIVYKKDPPLPANAKLLLDLIRRRRLKRYRQSNSREAQGTISRSCVHHESSTNSTLL